jgi:hypothetical protein
MQEEDDVETPIDVTVLIEKTDGTEGGLEVVASASEDEFFIENVGYYASRALATAEDVEGDWKRRGIYSGT